LQRFSVVTPIFLQSPGAVSRSRLDTLDLIKRHDQAPCEISSKRRFQSRVRGLVTDWPRPRSSPNALGPRCRSRLPPEAIPTWCRSPSRRARRREGRPAGRSSYHPGWPEDVVPGNVARIYGMGRDLRDGTHTAPSFDDAVAVHRVIAAIERAAESGSRTVLA
jgi:hypothetical protein